MSVGSAFPQAAANSTAQLTVTPELAASLLAGRQLWQQQASRTDKLQCGVYNGPVEMLRDAQSPITGTASLPLVNEQQVAAARAVIAAAAKAVAVQAATAARRGVSLSRSKQLELFTQAALAARAQTPAAGGRQVLPAPAADAGADVHWGGSSAMGVKITPGPKMSPASLHTAKDALQDSMVNMVSWLDLQVCGSGASGGCIHQQI